MFVLLVDLLAPSPAVALLVCLQEYLFKIFAVGDTKFGKLMVFTLLLWFCMSTYVDNLFAIGRTANGVATILDDAARELNTEWNLHIKPSSRCLMPAKNAIDKSVANPEKWPIVISFTALERFLQHDGGVNECFAHTLRQMWKAFWANCGCADARRFPLEQRLVLLTRAVVPVLRFRWTRWPFSISRAKHLDAAQRKMLKICVHVRPLPRETMEHFVGRRERLVGILQKDIGQNSLCAKRSLDGKHI